MRAEAATQARVVGALVLRETRTRFGRTQLGYLWALAEPVAFVAIFSSVFGIFSRHPPIGDTYAMFFATGLLPFNLFMVLAKSLGSAFDANQALLTYPIVKPIDTLFARSLLEIATALTVMLIVFGGLILIFEAAKPRDPFTMAAATLGLCLLGFGLGTINAVLGDMFGSWKQIFDVLAKPWMLLSAVFFTLDTLPESIRSVLSWLPMVHGVEGFRYGYFSNFHSNDLNLDYLYGWGLALTVIGLAAERGLRIWRR